MLCKIWDVNVIKCHTQLGLRSSCVPVGVCGGHLISLLLRWSSLLCQVVQPAVLCCAQVVQPAVLRVCNAVMVSSKLGIVTCAAAAVRAWVQLELMRLL